MLRDRITHSLVAIVERNPQAIFSDIGQCFVNGQGRKDQRASDLVVRCQPYSPQEFAVGCGIHMQTACPNEK